MRNLGGLHDREGSAIAPFDTWLLDTVALAGGPIPTDYARDFHWIARLNHGYGSTGTLPTPDGYGKYAMQAAGYVGGSLGCTRWIVGNEPNLSREWPERDGRRQPIYPWDYAACYKLTRSAIHAIPGHEHDEVLIAASGPWNDELKYDGNPHGDWIQYFADVIEACGSEIDGFAIHSYTHGYDTALVTSEATMNAPFGHRRYEFRTYRDYMAAIPVGLWSLPVYLTEANGNGPWQAAGLMPAMLGEIDHWNRNGNHSISAVIFYRYPHYDQDTDFGMENKPDVIAEYKQASGRGYQSPLVMGANNVQERIYAPYVPNESPAATLPDVPREIGASFRQRTKDGIEFATPPAGQVYYALVKAEYEPDGARRFGPDHHILVEVLDAKGTRKHGQTVSFVTAQKTIRKPVDKQGGDYGVDLDLYAPGYGYGVYVGEDRALSDFVGGMGMGTIEQPDWAHHVDFYLVFQERIAEAQIEQPSIPEKPDTLQPHPSPVPMLVHPVSDPRFRVVTQVFGVNGDYYKRFSVDGVPLRGHNGIDFGTPTGTEIVAVDDGWVIESANDPGGYGDYVKLGHAWGESIVAHLSVRHVQEGRVVKGDAIGHSGWTGNVLPSGPAGAHLHFGMRVDPFDRQDGWGGYTDPAPYLINGGVPVTPGPFLPSLLQPVAGPQPPARETYLEWFRRYGEQYAVAWHLLAALAYNENKFQTEPPSEKGALGLMQFMPSTWADMQAQLGVSDPLDPEQSIKAAAYYLGQIRSYLIRFKKYGLDWVLAGYNWGMGYSAQGSWEQVPPETKRWVDLIKETSEALRRWEDGW